MKTLKLSAIILLFSFISAGCQKDDIFELDIGDENAVIQKEVNGIEFKFCLLNEQGEPATVFNEGENFTFHFSFKNNTQDTIIVSPKFVNDDFFRVFSIQNSKKQDLGKPYDKVWCSPLYVITPNPLIIKPANTGGLECPWVLMEGYNAIPFCVNERKEYLDIGRYFTKLELDFQYSKGKKEFKINDKFKINFKIK